MRHDQQIEVFEWRFWNSQKWHILLLRASLACRSIIKVVTIVDLMIVQEDKPVRQLQISCIRVRTALINDPLSAILDSLYSQVSKMIMLYPTLDPCPSIRISISISTLQSNPTLVTTLNIVIFTGWHLVGIFLFQSLLGNSINNEEISM